MIFARGLQRSAALTAMIAVLYVLDLDLLGNHFWALTSIVGLTIVLEFLAYQHGVAEGIEMYRSLTPAQREEINKIMESEE